MPDCPAFRRTPSIRGRLLGYLLLPLVVLLVASVWVDHRTYVTPMYEVFDRALSRAAIAIAGHVQQNFDGQLYVEQLDPSPLAGLHEPGAQPPPPPAEAFGGRHAPMRYGATDRAPAWMRLYRDGRDSFLFRVSLPDGRTLAGDAGLPIAQNNEADDLAYGDVTYKQLPLRIASYHTQIGEQSLIVTVGETVHRRDRVVRRLDTAIGLSDGIQLLLVLGLCLFGITVALRPVHRLRERIRQRQPQSLQPLPLDKVPGEVRPLVESLNTLLLTVRDAALAQQHFLTNAAHQLRTPLTGLKAQLEVLANETHDTIQQERIARLHNSVDQLAHTASQLLALARAEPSAHHSGDVAPIQLQSLIGTVVDAMLDRALARNIDLGAECQPAQVQGVYWLLHELLINLVDNAVRHTPDNGQITLRCGQQDGAPFLEVEDSGPGIPPAERERVRERFYRAPGSDGQGSGLGLSIVDEIARGHRARFDILDAHEGSGARMRVVFPPPATT